MLSPRRDRAHARRGAASPAGRVIGGSQPADGREGRTRSASVLRSGRAGALRSEIRRRAPGIAGRCRGWPAWARIGPRGSCGRLGDIDPIFRYGIDADAAQRLGGPVRLQQQICVCAMEQNIVTALRHAEKPAVNRLPLPRRRKGAMREHGTRSVQIYEDAAPIRTEGGRHCELWRLLGGEPQTLKLRADIRPVGIDRTAHQRAMFASRMGGFHRRRHRDLHHGAAQCA